MLIARIHLPMRPPSDGAHQLGWWLLGPLCPVERMKRRIEAERVLGLPMLERLLHGEVTPGVQLGHDIMRLTDWKIGAQEFYRPALGGWGDCPAEAPMPIAA